MAEESKKQKLKKSGSLLSQLKQQEGEGKKKKIIKISTWDQIKFYGIPIVSVVLLVILLVWRVFPVTNALMEEWGKRGDLSDDLEEENKKLKKLKDIQSSQSQYSSDISKIDKYIPTEKSKVVDMLSEAKSLAEAKGLKASGSKAGETMERSEEYVAGDVGNTSFIVHIPTTFSLKGDLDDIKQFLDEVYSEGQLVTFEEMQLTHFQLSEEQKQDLIDSGVAATEIEDDYWTLEVTFTNYRFAERFSQKEDVGAVALNAEPYTEVLEKISSR